MDGSAASSSAGSEQQQLDLIKRCMPRTYKAIQAHAAEIGSEAFRLVRAGVKGRPNCFYAIEAGHVAGSPFNDPQIAEPVAAAMVRFGAGYVVIWAQQAPVAGKEGAHGPH